MLVSAGNIKREAIQGADEEEQEHGMELELSEQQLLCRSVCETLMPKLIFEDLSLLHTIIHDAFPDITYKPKQMHK